MREILTKWTKFNEGQDEGWTYDMVDEFFSQLSRGEMLEIMRYLSTNKESK